MNTRTIDLEEVINQLFDSFPTLIEVHLFGSRLYQTGSARSDIDVLVEFIAPFPSIGQLATWITETEPYVDIFVKHGDAATSAANGSQIVGGSEELLAQLGALCIWKRGNWLGDQHKNHRVIDSWAPIPTIATPGVAPFKPIDIPPPCEVLILSALPQEHEAVRSELHDPRSWSPAGNTAPTFEASLLRTVHGQDRHVAAAVFPRMGMAPAALTTKGLVDFLTPELVMLVGIAGGLSPQEVGLGDIVIPDAVFDYEAAKVTPEGEQRNGMITPVSSPVYQSIKERDWSKWKKKVGKQRPSQGWLRGALNRARGVPMAALRIHFDGPIASGHKVIADSDRSIALRAIHRKTASVDMESWGVAEACAFSRQPTPFVVIKAISDYADDQKNDDWHDFCCHASAKFAIELIKQDVV